MANEGLEPLCCPFCGNVDAKDHPARGRVVCGRCGACGPITNGDRIAAWNGRHAGEPVPEPAATVLADLADQLKRDLTGA